MFIEGNFTNSSSGETFGSYNPANGELLGEAATGGKDDA